MRGHSVNLSNRLFSRKDGWSSSSDILDMLDRGYFQTHNSIWSD